MTQNMHRPGGESEEYKSLNKEKVKEKIVILDSLHPALGYINSVRVEIDQKCSKSSLIATACSLLNDPRELTLDFPFCEETVQVSIQDFFEVYFQIVFKKGRFPGEPLFFDAVLQSCTTKLCYDAAAQRGYFLVDAEAKVPRHILDEAVTGSSDPYLIRTKNEFAKQKLPEETWGDVLRTKVLPNENRSDQIPEVGILPPMMHLFEQIGNNYSPNIWVVIQMYLLLIDPAYKNQEVSFEFRKTKITKNIRVLLSDVLNYDIGTTYYSTDLDGEVRSKLAGEFMKSHMHLLLDPLNTVKAHKNPPPELVYQINKNYSAFRKAIIRGTDLPEESLIDGVDEEWHIPPKVFTAIADSFLQYNNQWLRYPFGEFYRCF